MREQVVSNCEKAFLIKAVSEETRLDGRHLDEWRTLEICFGSTLGSCRVSLGNTKVAAHVSCKIDQPKQTKPNEGMLFVNIDLGPMGAPNFDNRQSDLNVYLNRLLEKCIIDSQCIDLESLCIVTEEKVWTLRIDIHILNHAGNLIECASVAALSSLAHFKRPDVTIDGEEIIIHNFSEKDPIPTVIHHYPVVVSFGFFSDEIMVADPSLLEEIVCSNVGAIFAVGMNSYKEVCLFDLTSAAITVGPQHIYKASNLAAKRSQFLVIEIKNALINNEKARLNKEKIGFANAISTDQLLTLNCDKLTLRLNKFDINNCIVQIMITSQLKENEHQNGPTLLSNKDLSLLIPTKHTDDVKWETMKTDTEYSCDYSMDDNVADSYNKKDKNETTPKKNNADLESATDDGGPVASEAERSAAESGSGSD